MNSKTWLDIRFKWAAGKWVRLINRRADNLAQVNRYFYVIDCTYIPVSGRRDTESKVLRPWDLAELGIRPFRDPAKKYGRIPSLTRNPAAGSRFSPYYFILAAQRFQSIQPIANFMPLLWNPLKTCPGLMAKNFSTIKTLRNLVNLQQI